MLSEYMCQEIWCQWQNQTDVKLREARKRQKVCKSSKQHGSKEKRTEKAGGPVEYIVMLAIVCSHRGILLIQSWGAPVHPSRKNDTNRVKRRPVVQQKHFQMSIGSLGVMLFVRVFLTKGWGRLAQSHVFLHWDYIHFGRRELPNQLKTGWTQKPRSEIPAWDHTELKTWTKPNQSPTHWISWP